jgi:hypothetical protein
MKHQKIGLQYLCCNLIEDIVILSTTVLPTCSDTPSSRENWYLNSVCYSNRYITYNQNAVLL